MDSEIILLAEEWTLEQIDGYIKRYEERVEFLHNLVKELKRVRRKKVRRKPLDTGAPRGGK